jgi:hypothetical protein
MEGWSHGGMGSWRGSHRSLYGDACGRLKDYVTSEAVSGGRKAGKGRQLDRFITDLTGQRGGWEKNFYC